MKKLILSLFLFSLLSSVALAGSLKDFNLQNFQQCQKAMKQCAKNSQPCILKVSQTNSSCTQLSLLAKRLQTTAAAITVKDHQGVYLITQHFTADGQVHYYLLTQSGKLIDTQPKVSFIAKKLKLAKDKIIIVNRSPVTFGKSKDGKQLAIIVTSGVHKGCLACAKIATIQKQF